MPDHAKPRQKLPNRAKPCHEHPPRPRTFPATSIPTSSAP
jgi:hypothetical protein